MSDRALTAPTGDRILDDAALLARQRPARWLWAASGAMVAIAALQAWQDAVRQPEIAYGMFLALEIPLWLTWLALFPAIFLLARRFPLIGPRWPAHLPVHLLAAAATPLVLISMSALLRTGIAAFYAALAGSINDAERVALDAALHPALGSLVAGSFASPVLLYFAVVAVHYALVYSRAFDRRMVRQSELEALLVRSQLEALKLQLQPHFLFNTLNTITALALRDPQGARRVAIGLSELLRYALQDDGGHEVSLADELQFLAGYVEIQKVRFRERLEVRFEVSEEARRMRVPRMLLQPLVENAIQHGAPEEGPAIITVRGECAGPRLRLSVTDNGPGFRTLASANGRVGIGLRNTSERLATLYRGRARVVMGRGEGGGAQVVVEVPSGTS